MEHTALNLLVLPMVQQIALVYLVMALIKLALDAMGWASARRREAVDRARVARLVFPGGPIGREDFAPRPAEDEPARRHRAR